MNRSVYGHPGFWIGLVTLLALVGVILALAMEWTGTSLPWYHRALVGMFAFFTYRWVYERLAPPERAED